MKMHVTVDCEAVVTEVWEVDLPAGALLTEDGGEALAMERLAAAEGVTLIEDSHDGEQDRRFVKMSAA